jgi:hypothetical protein
VECILEVHGPWNGDDVIIMKEASELERRRLENKLVTHQLEKFNKQPKMTSFFSPCVNC